LPEILAWTATIAEAAYGRDGRISLWRVPAVGPASQRFHPVLALPLLCTA
jgi:hypothetical protein